MNRSTFRVFGGFVLATVLVGCGGKVEAVESRPRASGLASFGAEGHEVRVYFQTSNMIEVDGVPTVAAFDLRAGSRVELEIATRDASPLRFELHRVRRDGTTELLSPVHSQSGFHLETFDTSNEGTFVVLFPAAEKQKQTVVVHLACEKGRCPAAQQPGETCDLVFPCDEGLACMSPSGRVIGYLEQGRCVRPE